MTAFDVLIIGGSGFVGSKLVDTALKAGLHVAYTYASNQLAIPAASFQVRIQEGQELETCIARVQPRCIVYCAVPPPQSDAYIHEAVSVQAVERICSSLKNLGDSKFIYISTNAVFSGQNGPYKEDDLPDPEKRHDPYRIYGLTRAQGEKVALDCWHNSIVVRTSDVNGKNQVNQLNQRLVKLLTQFEAGKPFERSKNAFISPTWVDNLADCLLEISGKDYTYRGGLHVAGSQQISYYDFACRIAEKVKADKTLIKAEFAQVWNISLDTRFTQSILRTPLLTVDEQLTRIFS